MMALDGGGERDFEHAPTTSQRLYRSPRILGANSRLKTHAVPASEEITD